MKNLSCNRTCDAMRVKTPPLNGVVMPRDICCEIAIGSKYESGAYGARAQKRRRAQQLNLRRKAATPSKAQPSRDIVEPPSGTPAAPMMSVKFWFGNPVPHVHT
jgi:hypothetical protein